MYLKTMVDKAVLIPLTLLGDIAFGTELLAGISAGLISTAAITQFIRSSSDDLVRVSDIPR